MDVEATLVDLGFKTPDVSLEEAINAFQYDRGLQMDGKVGRITERYLKREPYCGVVIPLQARGRICRWDHVKQANGWNGADYDLPEDQREPLTLSWHFVNPPSMPHLEGMREAFHRVSAVCGVRFVETDDERSANFREVVARIDGRGKTLALHYLPCGPENEHTQLQGNAGEPSGTFDQAEGWDLSFGRPTRGRTSWLGTVIHEIGGHGLGLEHGPETSIMSPYSNGVVEVDEWMTDQLVLRYGPKIERTTVPVPPGFPPSGAEGTAEVRIGGLIYRGDLSLAGGE